MAWHDPQNQSYCEIIQVLQYLLSHLGVSTWDVLFYDNPANDENNPTLLHILVINDYRKYQIL